MRNYAAALGERGYTLRSGGQPLGADSAFEEGAGAFPKQIYLPWERFEKRTDGIVVGDDERLRMIAAMHHPGWRHCSRGAKAMHTRNVPQILGHTEPIVLSDFVLCWTFQARGKGGTGQAIRIARAYGVPVYDLADERNTFEKDWLH